jgi:hypothetical protein
LRKCIFLLKNALFAIIRLLVLFSLKVSNRTASFD